MFYFFVVVDKYCLRLRLVRTVFETSVEYLVSQNLFQITINSQFKKDLYLQIHLHKTVFVVVTKQEFLLYGTKSMRIGNFLGLNI